MHMGLPFIPGGYGNKYQVLSDLNSNFQLAVSSLDDPFEKHINYSVDTN